MLLSMTGFGRGEGRLGSGRLQVEIRSVNHRFCEIAVRLPRSLAGLEGRIRERTQRRLSRGKINVAVGFDGPDSLAGRLRLNEEVSDAYFRVCQELKKRFRFAGEMEIGTFLALPDVLTWDQEEVDEDAAWGELSVVLDSALDDITTMKRQEGENLARDILPRLDAIQAGVDRVVARVPEMVGALRTRLEERLAEISGDVDFNRLRAEAEVVLLVDRTDCTEECVRLRSHVEQFRSLISAPEPAGRKLNFLLQEMNRETNTIGSKAQDVPIARDVIEMKEEIEKLREQVQNFE
jgi:uncharacterized protein (TIGR00255 family)